MLSKLVVTRAAIATTAHVGLVATRSPFARAMTCLSIAPSLLLMLLAIEKHLDTTSCKPTSLSTFVVAIVASLSFSTISYSYQMTCPNSCRAFRSLISLARISIAFSLLLLCLSIATMVDMLLACPSRDKLLLLVLHTSS